MRQLLMLVLLGALGFAVTPAEARHGYRHHRYHHHHHHRHHGFRSRQVAFQPQVHGMGCLRPKTRAMVAQLTARIGPIQITSTCGGRHAHNSQHYRGNAVDFRPMGTSSSHAVAVLRTMPIVGGIGSYGPGLVHADVGDRIAQWHGRGRGRRHYAGHHHRRHYAHHRRRGYGWS